MILTIPFEQFNQEVKQDYLDNNIKGIGLEYQYNGIYGYIRDQEVCIFNFGKYFKIDNRYSTYKIYCNSSQITIEFI